MIDKLKGFFEKVSDVLFPNNFKCIFCGGEIFDDNVLKTCKSCKSDLPFVTGKVCECCGNKIVKSMSDYCINCKDTPRFFDKARAVFQYTSPVSNTLKRYKTANAQFLARPLAMYLAQKYFELGWDVDCVVSVPLHKDVKRKRDFDHAYLLAQEFCKITMLDFDNNLQKVRNTVKQTELDFVGRQGNLEDAFKYNGECAGKNILIIDDVMTTGATTNTIAFELKRKGAKRVYALTVARTVFENPDTKDDKKK